MERKHIPHWPPTSGVTKRIALNHRRRYDTLHMLAFSPSLRVRVARCLQSESWSGNYNLGPWHLQSTILI